MLNGFLSCLLVGLMVKEKNWLEVYPYTSWGGNANLPVLEEGQTFTPSSIMLREVRYIQRVCNLRGSAVLTTAPPIGI